MRGDNRDANEKDIVAAWRKIGAGWLRIPCTGTHYEKGQPDGLVGFQQRNILVQIKRPGQNLTEEQGDWHNAWPGQICVVRTINEALEAVFYRDRGHFVEATKRECAEAVRANRGKP